MKQRLYGRIADELGRVPGIRVEDVNVVLTENGPADYSRGNGEAQVLDLTIAGDPGTL